MPTIETERLTKHYGPHIGIEDLDLSVQQGEVFGLLGPNGAGKSTTIRLLLDLIRPTRGSARIFGLDSRTGSMEIRRRTGYLPGDFATYGGLAVRDVLAYYANLRESRPTDLDRLCERFGLDRDRKVGEISRGNRQKLGLVQAYMHSPDLLVLDEPTTGLDPLLQIEFQELVAERKREGATQFISSHVLPEAAAICDRVGIIRDGNLVAVEAIETLRERSMHRVEITFAHDAPAEAFRKLSGVAEAAADGNKVSLTVTGTMDRVIKAAARYEVVAFDSHPPSVEEMFMTYYNGHEQVQASSSGVPAATA
jgi:ABC-2 type transport system ATP-binding protein